MLLTTQHDRRTDLDKDKKKNYGLFSAKQPYTGGVSGGVPRSRILPREALG